MRPTYDAVVVGAGPYGLSVSAHLRGRGLNIATFGKPLETWREHMPKGMVLRSHWWATDLSDLRGEFTFGRFLETSSSWKKGYPVPIDAFIGYARWFQEHAVPEIDETYVGAIERANQGFLLTLADGRTLEARSVVMAIGLLPYASRPPEFGGMPQALVSHSSDHKDFSRFHDRRVLVVGGGQSAIEYAALLHEAGARVQVVARRRILWLGPDRGDKRSLRERLTAPKSRIAPGWQPWVLDNIPYLFHRFPRNWRDRYNSRYESGASDWLRERVIGKVPMHEGRTVTRLDARGDRLDVTLSDGAGLELDHIVLATGYKVDLGRLTMLSPALRAEIRADRAIPELNQGFETSVPGLYFVGITSLRAFGPLYRFVAGCGAAAHRVARAVDGRRARSPNPMPVPEAASAA
jgi:cation diffusion facilitator CzcD-associated flavoprotein CzcO